MASLTQWTWVWASSGRWWRTGKPSILHPWGRKEPVMTEWLNNNIVSYILLWDGQRYNPKTRQFSHLVAQSCLTLCDPMGCSMPGFPVHHQPLELTQTHIHWISDAIQPSSPPSSPFPPSFNLSQHQGLSQWVISLYQMTKYCSFSFSISPSNEYSGMISSRMDWLDLLQSKGLSRVFSNTKAQKHQFFGAQLSSQSNSHIHIWLLEKP